ncbi:hypothetical protein KKC91_10855 [bacterium]|nr:hypothetical protein [bacterium]
MNNSVNKEESLPKSDIDSSIKSDSEPMPNDVLPSKEILSNKDPSLSRNNKEELDLRENIGDDYPLVDENHQEVLNYDGRNEGDWESRWSDKARRIIYREAVYVGLVFFFTLMSIVLIWQGSMYEIFRGECLPELCKKEGFDKFAYFFSGGVLGGVLFGMKYLYKVVARGFWHQDRVLWRIFSPWISGGLAVAVGALFDSGVMGLSVKAANLTTFFSLGFITGYFADSALAKMHEIAETIFSTSNKYPLDPKHVTGHKDQ